MSQTKNCFNCLYAVITLDIYECNVCDEQINFIHPGGMCPETLYCDRWEQADEFTLSRNSFDWNKALVINVD